MHDDRAARRRSKPMTPPTIAANNILSSISTSVEVPNRNMTMSMEQPYLLAIGKKAFTYRWVDWLRKPESFCGFAKYCFFVGLRQADLFGEEAQILCVRRAFRPQNVWKVRSPHASLRCKRFYHSF